MGSAENKSIGASNSALQPDIQTARLDAQAYVDIFDDLNPPLTRHEALVEADRCYFCYDAPCMIACPTSIDIPLFVRQKC